MPASHVNNSRHLRERAAEMRASAEGLKDNDTAAIRRLAEVYDRLADCAEIRRGGGRSAASNALIAERFIRRAEAERPFSVVRKKERGCPCGSIEPI